jgi:acetyl esterase/lipase
MRTQHLILLLKLGLAVCCLAQAPVAPAPTSNQSGPTTLVPLWPEGKMPGVAADKPEKLTDKGNNDIHITQVSVPTLAVYPAPNRVHPAPVIIVCPGGAYGFLAYSKEGTEIAAWINSLGATAMVLKYRVPNNLEGALQDIQRALRTVRAQSKYWNLDPARVGVIGFSAGGSLSVRASLNSEKPAYKSMDSIDEQSCRPDFMLLTYPAYLDREVNHPALGASLPPTFISQAEDDKGYVPGTKLYVKALAAAGAPYEFALYSAGGHGYGLRCRKEAGQWPQRCEDWLRKNGWISAPK